MLHHPICAATWNVLTLYPPGHAAPLAAKLFHLNITITGLQEVRWTGSGETSVDEYRMLWSGDNHHIQGVALAVHKKHTAAAVLHLTLLWPPIHHYLLCPNRHSRWKCTGYLLRHDWWATPSLQPWQPCKSPTSHRSKMYNYFMVKMWKWNKIMD